MVVGGWGGTAGCRGANVRDREVREFPSRYLTSWALNLLLHQQITAVWMEQLKQLVCDVDFLDTHWTELLRHQPAQTAFHSSHF